MAGYTVIDVNTALSAHKDGARSDLVLGGLRLEQGDRGVFITTSKFSAGAKTEAERIIPFDFRRGGAPRRRSRPA